jgi:putative ABC transport system permease protein
MNYSSIYDAVHFFEAITFNQFLILSGFIFLLATIICFILKTDFGIAMRATGNSETMIRALGVNTDRMKIIGLALANALTATGGYLICQLQGFTDINMGIGIVIVGLGSVIIAETFIRWFNISSISKSLFLVVAGGILFQLVLAFTLSIGIDATLLKLTTSVFVLLIVSLPRISFSKAA